MGNRIDPVANIVPLCGVDEAGGFGAFLGSASFIEEPTLLLTSDHVIRDWQHGFAVSIRMTMSGEHAVHDAEVVHRDSKRDLALLRVATYNAPTPLKIAKALPSPTVPVVSLDYGTTRQVGSSTRINPATRVGYITRFINVSDLYGPAGEDALELSFPALKGASGSPVLTQSTFEVLGVIFANVNYHLLPVQIETVADPDNNITEETRFMMPQGIAVNFVHIADMLAEFRQGTESAS
jgi:S1-C subfamily serine protease